MILTQIEGDILIAFISAVFGSIITLMFQWIVNYIGSTKIYFKIIDLKENPRYLKLSKLSRKERKILDGPFK